VQVADVEASPRKTCVYWHPVDPSKPPREEWVMSEELAEFVRELAAEGIVEVTVFQPKLVRMKRKIEVDVEGL
jgi:hypothetical protein